MKTYTRHRGVPVAAFMPCEFWPSNWPATVEQMYREGKATLEQVAEARLAEDERLRQPPALVIV